MYLELFQGEYPLNRSGVLVHTMDRYVDEPMRVYYPAVGSVTAECSALNILRCKDQAIVCAGDIMDKGALKAAFIRALQAAMEQRKQPREWLSDVTFHLAGVGRQRTRRIGYLPYDEAMGALLEVIREPLYALVRVTLAMRTEYQAGWVAGYLDANAVSYVGDFTSSEEPASS